MRVWSTPTPPGGNLQVCDLEVELVQVDQILQSSILYTYIYIYIYIHTYICIYIYIYIHIYIYRERERDEKFEHRPLSWESVHPFEMRLRSGQVSEFPDGPVVHWVYRDLQIPDVQALLFQMLSLTFQIPLFLCIPDSEWSPSIRRRLLGKRRGSPSCYSRMHLRLHFQKAKPKSKTNQYSLAPKRVTLNGQPFSHVVLLRKKHMQS